MVDDVVNADEFDQVDPILVELFTTGSVRRRPSSDGPGWRA